MIRRPTLWAQNHWLAHQVFNYRLQLAVVEEVGNCHSPADLRNLNRGSRLRTDVLEGSVSLIEEEQLRLTVPKLRVNAVNLWIDVSVDQENVLPSVIIKIHKRVSPSHISTGGRRNTRSAGEIGESHLSIIAIEGGVLVIKMRNENRHATGMQKVA